MAIGSPDKAEAYVTDCLARKEKIMGMGHREYRTVDPRAKILKPMAMELCTEGESRNLLLTLVAVEEACQRAFSATGQGDLGQRGVLQGCGIPQPGHSNPFLHCDVRHGAGVRLHRPFPRVQPEQSPDPAARQLYRTTGRPAGQVRRLRRWPRRIGAVKPCRPAPVCDKGRRLHYS